MGGAYRLFKTDLEGLDRMVGKLRGDGYTVYGPVKRGRSWFFLEVDSVKQMDLDYVRTLLPPKKLLHPPREKLFEFRLDGGFEVKEDLSPPPIVLFGVHPCDLKAIERQDAFFSQTPEDPYYLARRKNGLIVGLTCKRVDENCFCFSRGTGPDVSTGFDVLITDIGDGYLIEPGSAKGLWLLDGLGFQEVGEEYLKVKWRLIEELKGRFTRHMPSEGLAELAKSQLDHGVWREMAEKCLSCGSCSLVCPTCYCFDVYDVLEFDLKSGVRVRELDSCQLLEYAEVALGGNFRRDRYQRLRHWMLCKFGAAAGGLYSSCVGCGRCIVYCPAGIDLTEVARRLRGGG